jgi:hypothetical protein
VLFVGPLCSDGECGPPDGPDCPPARLEFLKSVILDTNTYSSHPQRDGGIATWQRHWTVEFLVGEGAHEICHCIPNGPIAAEISVLDGCVTERPCASKQQRDFRLPERETRMARGACHLGQNRGSIAIAQPSARTGLGGRARARRLQLPTSWHLPILTYLSHWSSFFRRSDRSMTGQNSLDKQS